MAITHRQRLINLLEAKGFDRPGVALWRHFPVDDQDPEELARSTLEFQAQYDFDLIKVTPASSFCVHGWGARDVWKGNPEGTRDYQEPAVKDIRAFQALKPLSPLEDSLGQQLRCLEIILANRQPDTPVIQTIFSPLSQAKNLLGKQKLLTCLRQYPQEMADGLSTITTTTIAFLKECIKLGVDGIFFAEQHAQKNYLTPVEFNRFAREFAVRILDVGKELWLNILHVHGDEIHFEWVLDYPGAQIINWHDQKSPPSLAEGSRMSSALVCGGLRQWETMAYGTPHQVRQEADRAITQMEGKPFILGTGCVLPIITPAGNIRAARASVEKAAR